jgi:hypothetical protein
MGSFSISLQTTFYLVLRPYRSLPCGTSLLLEIVLIFEPLSVPEIITGTTLSVLDQLTQSTPELTTSIAIVQASLKAFLH